MEIDESIYKAFLEEMHSLENFRMTYAAAHPSTPLDSDDPDVRRLIEAMAFFSARTHMAGIRNIVSARHRIFQQFFPYLLTPLPAMGIIQIIPTGQFVESVFFPKDTEIAVSSETEGPAIFRTLCDLKILPVSLTGMNMVLLPSRGYKIFLRIRSSLPISEEIGLLRFNINHLNDYHASMRVFYYLKKHIKKVSVVFDEKITESTRGKPCDVSFGMSFDEAEDAIPHPLQKERLFFHFPQQELFLNINVPTPPREWTHFTLLMDIDSKWPKNLRLNRELFHLFATPIINLQRSVSQPFISDGTKERFPIRHIETDKRFEFHSVMGVFRNEKEGMMPVRAGILSGGQGSYEIEQDTNKDGIKQHWVNLHFPRAFEEPKTFTVDALWLQPWLPALLRQKIRIDPYNKVIIGLNWNLMGDIIPHAENSFQEEIEGFMHLLTIKNKSMLNIDDVTSILRSLGSVYQGKFKGVVDLLADIRIEEASLQKSAGPSMLKLVYFLRFREISPAILPLVETFSIHVGRIIDTWISEAKVEIKVEVA